VATALRWDWAKWAAVGAALVIALSGWIFALATERGAVLADVETLKEEMASVKSQVEILKTMSERMGRMEGDISWIKRALDRAERSRNNGGGGGGGHQP